MESDLIKISERVEEQLLKLSKRLNENFKRIKNMENHAAFQIKKAYKNLSILSESKSWMSDLLEIIDILGEVERFMEMADGFDMGQSEETSLESLIECQNSF